MRITIRPSLDPRREIDITTRLVAAIADELAKQYGGNDALNWLEAEQHLARIIGQPRPVGPAPFLTGTSAAAKRTDHIAACPGCPRRRAGERAGAPAPLRLPEPRAAAQRTACG